jgi:signal transduction histidine kinase
MRGAPTANIDVEDQHSWLAAEQAALRRVATLVAQGVSADELFGAVTAEVGRLFGTDLAGLSKYAGDDSVQALALWAADGEPPDVSGIWEHRGGSISGMVFASGGPVRVDGWDHAEGVTPEACQRLGIRSSAACPIVVDGHPWGVLVTHSKTTPLAGGIEFRMAEFAEIVATAISNTEARVAISRLADEHAALRRVATLVARESPAGDVFAAVAEEVGRLFGVSAATVFRYVGQETAHVVASSGEADALIPVGTRVPLTGDNIAVRIWRGASSVRIEDVAEVSGAIGEQAGRLGIRSGVGAPIIVAGELWGGIVATTRRAEPLPADAESRVAQFTELMATAISNTEARAELAASRARLVAAADAERRRLVRDLHDGAQQRLVHTVLTLNLACQAVGGNARARALLGKAADHAQRATTELRELAHAILPSVLTHGGLPAAVDALASRMPVPVALELPAERFAAAVEATAYFVIAEALTNVAKHARAERADVSARVRGDALQLEIRDDGVGGARSDGPGLVVIADRLAALGGRLEITSAAGAGTCVAAAIPLRPESSC